MQSIHCSVNNGTHMFPLDYLYTEAKKKGCIYKHLLITKYFLFYEENLSLNGIKSLIDLSSFNLFQLLLKSHDYKVILNA